MYKAKVNCIVDNIYHYAGDIYRGTGNPGRHFQKFDHVSDKEPEIPESETLLDEQIKSMSKKQIVNFVKDKRGVRLDENKKKDTLIIQALDIINGPTRDPFTGEEIEEEKKVKEPINLDKVMNMGPDAIHKLTKEDLMKRLRMKGNEKYKVEDLIQMAIEKEV